MIKCVFHCECESDDNPAHNWEFEETLLLDHVPQLGDRVTLPGFVDGYTGIVDVVDWDLTDGTRPGSRYAWLHLKGDESSGYPTGPLLKQLQQNGFIE